MIFRTTLRGDFEKVTLNNMCHYYVLLLVVNYCIIQPNLNYYGYHIRHNNSANGETKVLYLRGKHFHGYFFFF